MARHSLIVAYFLKKYFATGTALGDAVRVGCMGGDAKLECSSECNFASGFDFAPNMGRHSV